MASPHIDPHEANAIFAAATLASGLLIGLIPTLVDGLRNPLKTRLNLPDAQADRFVTAFYLTWLPAMPLAGLILEILPLREMLLVGLFGLILGIAWLALVGSPKTLLANGVVLGAAYSCVTVSTVQMMSVAFFPPTASG